MPRYDFCCTICGHEFELKRGFSEAGDPAVCPVDAGEARRVFTPPMTVLGAGEASSDRVPAAPPTPGHGHGHSHGPGGHVH